MKVIVAGSRKGFNIRDVFQAIGLSNFHISELVSGNANGVDRLGENYAERNRIPLKVFKADWDKYKSKAGFVRNVEMAKYADALIAIWDGTSTGTKHMIGVMKKLNKPTYVHCSKIMEESL